MTAEAAERPTADARIKAALWFAERGFGIFAVWSASPAGVCKCPAGAACSSPGKHPITANGFKDATQDPQRIRTLLSAGSEPNYGMVPPDGVFALDVDEDDNGLEKLKGLETEYGPLPATLRTKTRHGEHIFLRWPEAYPRPIKKMFGYVTRWGSGKLQGYVIGPRSVHPSGWEYAPAEGTLEIAPIPDAWAAAAVEPVVEIRAGPAPLPSRGGRHDWLRDKARHYRGFIDDPAVLRAALLAENARLADPKSVDDVERAIGNVYELFPADAPTEVEERVSRRLGDTELDLLGAPASETFPEPPAMVAFDGLLGELVDDLAAGTDASMVGLLGSLAAFCGALIPARAYFHREQTSSPYIALVGESSIGRKGTAMTRAADAMANALEQVTVNRAVMDGVNSGEGLVSSLYYKKEHYGTEPTVGLMFEEEYASLLASRGREGSTLDPKMRQAFDGGPLSNRRSGETKTVNPPYWVPALIGITPVELRQRLEPGSTQTGSANRWLYLPVTRRLHDPTNSAPVFSTGNRDSVSAAHRAAVKLATGVPLTVDPVVTRRLGEYSDFLPGVSFGLAHDLTRRLGTIAFRVALVHAALERSPSVTGAHLDRALALTEYARQGVPWVFGDTIGNVEANLLFRHLADRGRLTRNEITREIVRDPVKRQAAIDELTRIGRAQILTIQTGGRTRSELVLTPNRGAFVHFVQGLDIRTSETAGSVDEMDESAQTLGRKVDESRTEAGRKLSKGSDAETLDESWTKGSADVGRKLDESFGQKVDESSEHIACHFYHEHHAEHRFNGIRWVCPICDPDPESA